MYSEEQLKAVEEHLKKVLAGPPEMRELSPTEFLAIEEKATMPDGRLDQNKRIKLTLQAMLGKDPTEVAKTVGAYSDLVERMTFILAPTSRRIALRYGFLQLEGLTPKADQSSSI